MQISFVGLKPDLLLHPCRAEARPTSHRLPKSRLAFRPTPAMQISFVGLKPDLLLHPYRAEARPTFYN